MCLIALLMLLVLTVSNHKNSVALSICEDFV